MKWRNFSGIGGVAALVVTFAPIASATEPLQAFLDRSKIHSFDSR